MPRESDLGVASPQSAAGKARPRCGGCGPLQTLRRFPKEVRGYAPAPQESILIGVSWATAAGPGASREGGEGQDRQISGAPGQRTRLEGSREKGA